MSGDLREDLEAAFSGGTDGAADQGAAEAQPSAIGGGEHDFQEALPTGTEQQADTGRARDPSGRFAPKANDQQVPADQQPDAQNDPLKAQAAAAAGQPPAQQAQQPAQAVKAPASWTPEARETWAQMRPEHQQEVMRREREITTTLQQTADVRRFAGEFERVIQPFMGFIAAENSTPLQAVHNMMQTAAVYRIGTAQQKAEMTASLIKNFGVDIEMLDSLLAGQQAPQRSAPQHDVQQAVQQALAPFMQQIQSQRQQQEQLVTREANTELETFASNPDNEFFNDVRHDMADLMQLAAQRGQVLSLSDAYRRATLAHPQIAKVLEGRQRNAAAAQQTAAAQRARNAAASIPNSGAPSRNDEQDAGDDLRSALIASSREVAARQR